MNIKDIKPKKIWIDLDNSPHVPFLTPIIKELEQRGHTVILTARDCFQVCGLADLYDLKYKRIGHHYGKNKILKIVGTIIRSLHLLPTALKEKPTFTLSHGSRSQLITANILRIPTVMFDDYEFTQDLCFIAPDYVIGPEIIPKNAFNSNKKQFFRYPGIKEDVYIPTFKPDPNILNELGLVNTEVVITIRPPATEAHYHNPESENLFIAVVEFVLENPDVRIVILPRNEIKQTNWIKKMWAEPYKTGKIIIPDHVVNGLDLIWHSDFVVSGGGTMNREAAALGVPVYSIFRGKIGAVDQYLSDTGRLTFLESVQDIKTKIKIVPRDKFVIFKGGNRGALKAIMGNLEDILNDV